MFGCFGFVLLGCGTTKWSDTTRTATEQLLLSDAIDHAVEKLNFGVLDGKKVFVSTTAIEATTDYKYLTTTIRQQIASHGGIICDTQDDAQYIVELRTGAVGTDRNDVMIGIPAFSLPTTAGTAPQIPEIPFVKKTDQRAVAKIAIHVYNKETGLPLWNSGNRLSESRAKAWWLFGTGPYNRGNIYEGTRFAGGNFSDIVPFRDSAEQRELPPLTAEQRFIEPKDAKKLKDKEEPGSPTEATQTADAGESSPPNPAGPLVPPGPFPPSPSIQMPTPPIPPRISTYGQPLQR